ncbi:hypothetical protein D9M72_564970 [compost metagenome]
MLGVFPPDHHHTVSVSHDDVAGGDDDAGDRHRNLQPPRSELVGSGRRHGTGKHRQPAVRQGVGVANGAVNDEPGDSHALGPDADQVPDEGAGNIAAAVDHNDVPRLGAVEGLVDEQVVAGTGPHRVRRAGEFGAGPDGREPGGHADPFLGVPDVCRRYGAEASDDVACLDVIG